jgi:hypothetical protein
MRITPCVGCGYCCVQAMCVAGSKYLGTTIERCPYLIWIEDKYRCRLVVDRIVNPKELYIGDGCSSALFNDWRTEIKQR